MMEVEELHQTRDDAYIVKVVITHMISTVVSTGNCRKARAGKTLHREDV